MRVSVCVRACVCVCVCVRERERERAARITMHIVICDSHKGILIPALYAHIHVYVYIHCVQGIYIYNVLHNVYIPVNSG